MLSDFFFNLPPFVQALIKGLAVILVIFPIAGACSMAERKIAAWVQDRPGPNRAVVPWIAWIPFLGKFLQRLGIFHVLADGGKMMFKEDSTPGHVNKFYFIAAPILACYVVWPGRFSWQRVAVAFVPAAIAFFAIVQVVYYGALGATRQHPLQSIMVFDLGGISHFAKQNQYPVTWTAAETKLLINGCYRPTEWDLYWRLEPCEFVMHRLEGDKIFGTAVITDAWLHAIARHPLAYLEHRAAFMWNFLTNDNLTMWTADIDHPSKTVFANRPAFNALVTIHNLLKPTPLFRAGSWLLVCIAVCALAWRRRNTPSGAFAIGVCGSAAAYTLTFFAVGVASDFRYAYWAVLASIAGAVALAQGRIERA